METNRSNIHEHVQNPTEWVSEFVKSNSVIEDQIANRLTELQIEFFREVSFEGLRYNTGYYARFDFYIPSLKMCIEYDGEDFHSSTDELQKDKLKTDFCNRYSIKLLRLNKVHLSNLNKLLHKRTSKAKRKIVQKSKQKSSNIINEILNKVNKKNINPKLGFIYPQGMTREQYLLKKESTKKQP